MGLPFGDRSIVGWQPRRLPCAFRASVSSSAGCGCMSFLTVSVPVNAGHPCACAPRDIAGVPSSRSNCGHSQCQGIDRSGRPLRPPGQPLEPQDAALYLWPPQSDPHYRRPRNDSRAVAGEEVSASGRRRGQASCCSSAPSGRRRHAGARMPALRHALRRRPLAGRHADQLPHDPQPADAAGRARKADGHRGVQHLHQEDAVGPEARISQDVSQPQRHPHA